MSSADPKVRETRKPRRSSFSFSLRSLLILTTLICVGIGVKQQYEWRRKRALIHEWIAPLVAQAMAANGDVLRYQHPDAVRAKPVGLSPEDEVPVLMFGILESETPEERFASLQVLFAWRERFFQNPGRRALNMLSPEQYDRLCPLKIRPVATKAARSQSRF